MIRGIELAWGNEEVLTFGSAFIEAIMAKRDKGLDISVEEMAEMKHLHGGGMVLCHPGEEKNWELLRPVLDGYEHYNSGSNQFKFGERTRSLGVLEGLPGWCNSDAHGVDSLDRAYNIVGTKIESESDLIRYIKRGRQPEPYLKVREFEEGT